MYRGRGLYSDGQCIMGIAHMGHPPAISFAGGKNINTFISQDKIEHSFFCTCLFLFFGHWSTSYACQVSHGCYKGICFQFFFTDVLEI